jgi:predicted amidohydrolase YtcJ
MTTILYGPVFWTANTSQPEVAALEIDAAGLIVALHREVPARGRKRLIRGALCVPGLHDSHLHVQGLGRTMEELRLGDVADLGELREAVAAFAADHPELRVVRGRGWDHTKFPGRVEPTAADLEGLTGRPIYLTRHDGHVALCDHRLLELAQITAVSEDPIGGLIGRTASGAPNGLLVDNAMALVKALLPVSTELDRRRWLHRAMGTAQAHGLTSLHDVDVAADTFATLVSIAQTEGLPVRVFAYIRDDQPGWALLEASGGMGEVAPGLHLMGLKTYLDGALGSRGAAMLAPYVGQPHNRGLILLEQSDLIARLGRAHRMGYQTATHAIGDAANRLLLDAIEAAQAGDRTLRHRVEHAQIVDPADFHRFAELGAVASMQPIHALSDMRWAEDWLGAARMAGAYPWRSLLDAGAHLALGSDAPIESIDPRLGLYAATCRAPLNGGAPWFGEQRLSVDDALLGVTHWAASAVHAQDWLGQFAVGARFEATVFDADVRAQPEAWPEVAAEVVNVD